MRIRSTRTLPLIPAGWPAWLSVGERLPPFSKARWIEGGSVHRYRRHGPLGVQPITRDYAEALRVVIEQRGTAEGWLFPSKVAGTKDGRRSSFRAQFYRAVVRAELDPKLITPHVMRHTAVTRLVKSGVDIPTIQKVSGHKTIAMVLRYTHVDAPHIDDAMTKLGSGFSGAITPKLHIVEKLAESAKHTFKH